MAQKVRKIGTIWKNLQVFCNPAKPSVVKTGHKFSKYRGGTAGNQAAHIAALNRHDPFDRDDVSLRPQDVPSDALVGQVLVALVVEYEKNGWEVVK